MAQINTASLTKIGNMTTNGIGQLFDGNPATNTYNPATTGYVGITLSGPTRINSAQIDSQTNGFDASGATTSVTLKLYAKTGSAPSSGTDGTLLATEGPFTDVNSINTKTLTSSDQSTQWDHVWIYVQTGVWCGATEVRFYEQPAPASSVRELLTADRIYYVRTDGNNSNDGLTNTSGGAFLTIQKAWDVIAGTIDLGIYTAKIKIADGTYTDGVNDLNKPAVGGTVLIEGNTTTPANVIISCSSADCIEISRSTVHPSGLELRNSGGSGIHTYRDGVVNIGPSMRFGACSEAHLFCDNEGQIIFAYDYSIVGNAPYHWLAHTGGFITCDGRTATFTGTPAFGSAFAYALRGGIIEAAGNTYTGAMTGRKYVIDNGGIIYTGGGTLPGSVAGVLNAGFYDNTST